MLRRAFAVLAMLLALLVAVPAGAITNGTPDGNAHPNVGALLVDYSDEVGEVVWCSGTLIDAQIFLTAAHCFEDDLDYLGVSFEEKPISFDADGIGHVNGPYIPIDIDTDVSIDPGYPGPESDPHDLAIVELTSDPGIAPADLPSLGSLATLARKHGLDGQQFTAVGYGSTGRAEEPGTPTFIYPDERMWALSTFRALNKAWLRLSMNPATGDGGTCYGDSGGPNFLGAEGTASETDMIAAITITGDTVCRATNVVYRLDTVSAQEFLGQFVALPQKADKAKADKGKGKNDGKDRGGKRRQRHRH